MSLCVTKFVDSWWAIHESAKRMSNIMLSVGGSYGALDRHDPAFLYAIAIDDAVQLGRDVFFGDNCGGG